MNTVLAIFLIAASGYLLGSIKIGGIKLGSSGVLLSALVFGHFSQELGITAIPAAVRNLGLACFVGSVGFIAGPQFFRDFKKNAASYILLGLLIPLSGMATCVVLTLLSGHRPELMVGLLTGALTSTPGLAAAQEASGELIDLATTGYAIGYPFGIVGIVLFVQIIPKILHIDMEQERAAFQAAQSSKAKAYTGKLAKIDPAGFGAYTLAVSLGVLLGQVQVPLPGGATFSLGTAGGPLILGLIFGHFGHFGALDVSVPSPTLKTLREFGLMLFLVGAGFSGGIGFIETLQTEGMLLFVYGAIMTTVPLLVGYFFAAKVLKMRLLNNLGAITGGRTSTPALGALISVAGTDDVATAYAATYPIALVTIVLCSQFVVILLH